MTATPHADLLARHRRVMPSWLALYYDEPIELVSGSGRHVVDGEGTPLPRLLRRDPHHHDGLRRARGGRRHPHAGGPDDPHLDALPHPPDGRAGRADAPAVGHPRRQGLLHHLGHRGQRGRAAAGLDRPALQPGAGAAQQLPRALVRHDRHHRQPGLVGVEPDAVHRPLRRRRLPVPRPGRTARSGRRHRRGGRRPARRDRHRHRRRRRLPDRRADPGRRRVHRAARRAVRRDEEGARRARDPLRLRRGADRMGPHRRPLLGLPGPRRRARPAHLRQGRRQRPGAGRRGRAGRAHGRPARPTRSRRSAATRSSRPGRSPTSTTCSTTTCRPTLGPRAAACSTCWRRWPTSSTSSARCGARA